MEPALVVIRNRWSEVNRLAVIDNEPYKVFEKAQQDVEYLLNRLEVAETAAINGYRGGRAAALQSVLENLSLYTREIENSIMELKEEKRHGR